MTFDVTVEVTVEVTVKVTVEATLTTHNPGPHSDCRNYYWEPEGGNLILLSDGGAFLRTQPAAKGGSWRSLQGDIGAMELVSASYDPITKSWVGGAQDNSVQLAGPNADAKTRAVAIVGGDGTFTAVDSTVSPSRFYGTYTGRDSTLDAHPALTHRLPRLSCFSHHLSSALTESR